MKIIDLQTYRKKLEIKKLQEKVSNLALNSHVGAAQQIKISFASFIKLHKAG